MKKISLPKIGIRPVIDGRRMGVRESLEAQTMNMAKATAALISEKLRHACGARVECVIADTCIAGMAESAACEEKFSSQNVGVTITVTPCWCYGTETTDMDPAMPHAIWGFNGTERPGAVYLAAALAGHAQIGIPAFGIYGEHVQDADDTSIPEDVRTRLLDYATAGLAVAQMKGEAYLSMGSVSMGIAGSVVDPDFFGSYLGMRNEYIDMTEFTRRIEEGIYDPEEYEQAYQWIRENFKQGKDWNPPEWQYPEKHEDWWKFVTKMTLIARDLMHGNPRLAELGFEEEAGGHGAIAAGFQGQRQWTDHFPNGDVLETILNTNFDWTGIRQPSVVATENDSLNGASMLFGYLLTNTPQIFSDVRTYWSPESIEKATGWKPEGRAAAGLSAGKRRAAEHDRKCARCREHSLRAPMRRPADMLRRPATLLTHRPEGALLQLVRGLDVLHFVPLVHLHALLPVRFSALPVRGAALSARSPGGSVRFVQSHPFRSLRHRTATPPCAARPAAP